MSNFQYPQKIAMSDIQYPLNIANFKNLRLNKRNEVFL